MPWGPDDIIAIKRVGRSRAQGLVYLGAAGPAAATLNGVWSTRAHLPLLAPATNAYAGNVGDFLAVSTTQRTGIVVDGLNRLVVLRQQSGLFTHLGIVRSPTSLIVTAPADEFTHFIWLEIIAVCALGFDVQVAGIAPNDLYYNKRGGRFTRVDNYSVLNAAQKAQLRQDIWNGFGLPNPTPPTPPVVASRGAVQA